MQENIKKLLPAQVQKIGVLANRAIVIRLCKNEKINYFYFVPCPEFHSITISSKSPGRNYPRAEWLGKHLKNLENSNLVSFEKADGENVFFLNFESRDKLAFHFFGRQGNSLLINKNNKILAVWHPCKWHQIGKDYVRSKVEAGSKIKNMGISQLLENLELKELEDTRVKVVSFLQKERKKLENRLKKIKNDEKNAKNAEKFKKFGELLKTNYHLLKKRMNEIEVTNLFSPDQEKIVIPLESGKTPQENVSAYFKKAKKFARAPEIIADRIKVTKEELASIDEKCRLQSTIFDVCELKKFLPEKKKKKVEKPKQDSFPGIRKLMSSDGFLILAGKNAKDNDRLTVQIANGNDLWLHTRGRPGTHVVVRAQRNKEFSHQTIVEAAKLCAYLSKCTDGCVEDVSYTLRKHVTKPRGAKPGLVLVAASKTISVKNNKAAIKEWMKNAAQSLDPRMPGSSL